MFCFQVGVEIEKIEMGKKRENVEQNAKKGTIHKNGNWCKSQKKLLLLFGSSNKIQNLSQKNCERLFLAFYCQVKCVFTTAVHVWFVQKNGNFVHKKKKVSKNVWPKFKENFKKQLFISNE